MHQFVRRIMGPLARLLVVLLTLGTSVPVAVHGDAGHDPCDAGDIGPLAPQSLHGPAAATKTRHCDVCHWLRSLRAFDAAVEAPAISQIPTVSGLSTPLPRRSSGFGCRRFPPALRPPSCRAGHDPSLRTARVRSTTDPRGGSRLPPRRSLAECRS